MKELDKEMVTLYRAACVSIAMMATIIAMCFIFIMISYGYCFIEILTR